MEKSKIKTRSFKRLSPDGVKQWFKYRYPAYIWQIAYILHLSEQLERTLPMKFDGRNMYFFLTLEYESDNVNLDDLQGYIQEKLNQSKLLDKNCFVTLYRGKEEDFNVKFSWVI